MTTAPEFWRRFCQFARVPEAFFRSAYDRGGAPGTRGTRSLDE